MAWRYINPGYVHLLDADAQATATQVTGNEYSKTGVAFSQTNYYSAGITIANFHEGDDFWARFDVYIPNSTSGAVYCYAPYTYRSGFNLTFNTSNFHIIIDRAGSTDKYIADGISWSRAWEYGLKRNAINSILIHAKYVTDDGYWIEININGTKTTYSPNNPNKTWNYNANYKYAILYAASRSSVSNIIFSNEEINIKEQVVALPVSTTETTMTAQEGGIYLADNVGQTLLQTIDASALISQYGSDSKVTGIALVGTPAYRTGEQLSSLTAISKNGGVTTEHGTSNLSDASDTVIWQGFSVASDTTIADLQNMQLGWKAGE